MGEQLDCDPRTVVEQLLDGWETQQGAELDRSRKLDEAVLVWGYAAHAHQMARAALVLHDADLGLPAKHCLRLTYECALTAHWVAQVSDAVNALAVEQERHTTNLAKEIIKAGFAFASEKHQERANTPLPQLPTTSTNSARRFESLCYDLTPAGAQAYAHYRALSAYSHASPLIADEYAAVDETGTPRITLARHGSKTGLRSAELSFLAANLIWAARAFDFMDKKRSRRNELRRTAKLLGVAEVLSPSDEVIRRGATRKTRR